MPKSIFEILKHTTIPNAQRPEYLVKIRDRLLAKHLPASDGLSQTTATETFATLNNRLAWLLAHPTEETPAVIFQRMNEVF